MPDTAVGFVDAAFLEKEGSQGAWSAQAQPESGRGGCDRLAQEESRTVDGETVNGGRQDHGAVIYVLADDELEEAVNSTLARAGCTLEQLREEARTGEFTSESNWRTWFCIAPFVEHAS